MISKGAQAMVETVNNLLQPQALNAWRDLPASDQLRAATMLLDTVEESAFVLADNLLKTDIVRESTDNILKPGSGETLETGMSSHWDTYLQQS
ncbi:UNVERIFIED_CONTAM: Adhesion G protein-coupled receptor L3 [Gekko kuhli]